MTKKNETELKNEIAHIFNSGANETRVFEMVKIFISRRYEAINFTGSSLELPDLKDVNDELYKVSNNLKTDHKQTEVNYYESGFLTCYHWLVKRMKK